MNMVRIFDPYLSIYMYKGKPLQYQWHDSCNICEKHTFEFISDAKIFFSIKKNYFFFKCIILFLKCVFYTHTFICFETETHTYLLNLILNRDTIIWLHVYIQILTILTRCWKSNIWNLWTQCSNNNKDFFLNNILIVP